MAPDYVYVPRKEKWPIMNWHRLWYDWFHILWVAKINTNCLIQYVYCSAAWRVWIGLSRGTGKWK